jgi:outer membrane lipoprotein-sorting protein
MNIPIPLRSVFPKYSLAAFFVVLAIAFSLSAQTPDIFTIIQGVDASVKSRNDKLADYTVTEHYVVYRGQDQTHAAADMTVRTVYRKQSGKDYTVLAQTGSTLMRNEVLGTLLDHEKRLSQPGNMETALIDSANYNIKLDPETHASLNGRDCLLLDISPKRSSEYLFNGKLWVDANDYSIVQLQGTASKSAFFLAKAAYVSRQYDRINGLPMATHAEAISGSSLLGQTVVKIDYLNYQIDLAMNP